MINHQPSNDLMKELNVKINMNTMKKTKQKQF